MNRAVEPHLQYPTSHARCEGASQKYQTSSLFEVNDRKRKPHRTARCHFFHSLHHRPLQQLLLHRVSSSDGNRCSPSYYGFDNSSSDSTIAAPPKRPHRAGDVEKFQPPPKSVVETVKNVAVQQPEETNISPIIGEVSPSAPKALSILEQDTPKMVRSMTVFEAENQEMSDYLNSQPKLHKLSAYNLILLYFSL